MMKVFFSKLYWFFFPPAFVIKLVEGRAKLVRSEELPHRMLADFSELAANHQLSQGTIYGVRSQGSLVLEFSPDIPCALHQRFRNVAHIYL